MQAPQGRNVDISLLTELAAYLQMTAINISPLRGWLWKPFDQHKSAATRWRIAADGL